MLEYWVFSLVSVLALPPTVNGSPSSTLPPPCVLMFLMSYRWRPRAPAYCRDISVLRASCRSIAASQNCVCAVRIPGSTCLRLVGGSGTLPDEPDSGPVFELVIFVLLITTTA